MLSAAVSIFKSGVVSSGDGGSSNGSPCDDGSGGFESGGGGVVGLLPTPISVALERYDMIIFSCPMAANHPPVLAKDGSDLTALAVVTACPDFSITKVSWPHTQIISHLNIPICCFGGGG